MTSPTLLICTVGGSPEPVVASLKHWQPARAVFVPTQDTRENVTAKILPLLAAEGLNLGEGSYEVYALADGQNFAECIKKLRELNGEVERWLDRSEAHQVVVDFTGGTKCMSAAIAVQAHNWKCTFSYVGGSERTKENVGIVVSGKEQVIHAHNPWDSLGFQAVEEAITLFDQGAYASASSLIKTTLKKVQNAVRKREINVIGQLADAYDAWDRFKHRQADQALDSVQKAENDLYPLFSNRQRSESLLRTISSHRSHLAQLDVSQGPSLNLVKDLLANATRRVVEGRFDDAVARLYRAIEALAQTQLRAAHGFEDTGNVPLERVPEPLRLEWATAASGGLLKLGLQDAYRLLATLGDPLGQHFTLAGLDNRERSPLVSRNQSILAHGFQPVAEKVCQQLWETAMKMAQLTEADLPRFPRLGARN